MEVGEELVWWGAYCPPVWVGWVKGPRPVNWNTDDAGKRVTHNQITSWQNNLNISRSIGME